MNGGNCIFCIFCVLIGIWLIFVDIFTQSNTKLSLKGFLEVLWIKYWNVSNWLSWLLNGTDDIAIFGQCWQQGFGKQPVQCWQQLQRLQGCQQSIACRHILTVIKITPTTCSLWQCHQHWPMSSAGIESVLCVLWTWPKSRSVNFQKRRETPVGLHSSILHEQSPDASRHLQMVMILSR